MKIPKRRKLWNREIGQKNERKEVVMPILIRFVLKELYRVIVKGSLKKIIFALIVLYFGVWIGLYYTEGPTSELMTGWIKYTYFFVVTVTTVGYGDLGPLTDGGRVICIFLILFGVSLATYFVGTVISILINFFSRKRRGLVNLNLKNHIVLLGYHPGRTEMMVKQILADDGESRKILLCSDRADENPIEGCSFVKGKITSEATRVRACLDKADCIVVHGQTDEKTLAALWVVNKVNKHARIIALVEDSENEQFVEAIEREPKIECIASVQDLLAVQELQDPGVSRMIEDLLCNKSNTTPFRFDIPGNSGIELTFARLFHTFREREYGMVIAVDEDHFAGDHIYNPPDNFPVKAGGSFFYIGSKRIGEKEILKAIQPS